MSIMRNLGFEENNATIRKEILDVLTAAKKETTILFSTHILSDVEHICDEMALLNDGKIVMQGRMEDVKKQRRGNSTVIITETVSDCALLKAAFSFLSENGEGGLILSSPEHLPEVLRFIADENIDVAKIEKQEATLEDIFLDAIKQEEL